MDEQRVGEWLLRGALAHFTLTPSGEMLRLSSKPNAPNTVSELDLGWGVSLLREIDAKRFQGKRIRLSVETQTNSPRGEVRCELSIWSHPDPAQARPIVQASEPIAGVSERFTSCTLSAEVPQAATRIEFGISKRGHGEVFVRGVAIQ